MIGAKTSETGVASTRDAIIRHLIGLHLRHQEYTVAPSGEHTAEELLRSAVAIISRRIEQVHSERNTCLQCRFFNRQWMSSLTEMPTALAQRCNGGAFRKFHGALRLRGHDTVARLRISLRGR